MTGHITRCHYYFHCVLHITKRTKTYYTCTIIPFICLTSHLFNRHKFALDTQYIVMHHFATCTTQYTIVHCVYTYSDLPWLLLNSPPLPLPPLPLSPDPRPVELRIWCHQTWGCGYGTAASRPETPSDLPTMLHRCGYSGGVASHLVWAALFFLSLLPLHLCRPSLTVHHESCARPSFCPLLM